MRKKRKRPLARTSIDTETVYFFDRITYPHTFKLSSFYICKFYLDNNWWHSTIHYYQANKTTPDNPVYSQIRDCTTPEQAKKIGSTLDPIESWHSGKYELMKAATYAKFSQNKGCMTTLISTGVKPLMEYSRDSYWGAKNYGYNYMGQILEEVRSELRKKLRME